MENMEGEDAGPCEVPTEPIKVEIFIKEDKQPQLSLRSSTRAKKSLSQTEVPSGFTDEDQSEEMSQTESPSVNNAMAEAVQNAISELVSDTGAGETPSEADEPGSSTTTTVILTEAEPTWNQNNCIVCNTDLDEFDAELKKITPESKDKLLKFFCEYLNVKETAKEMANDNIVPFCPTCAGDIEKLLSLACKIEFMDSQFERLRDTVARKTVKTYLYRNKPELLDEKAEMVPDMADEQVDTSEQMQYSHPVDMIFNSWKRKYDMIIPGRFKKFPVLAKSIDARQRVSYYRIDSSGKHHLITSIGPGEEREEANEARVKRNKSASTLLANNPQIVIKRFRMDDSLADVHGEESMDIEYGDTSGAKHAAFPYECSDCPRSYATKSLLKYHARVHSGEKPFKCHHCSKAFAQRGGLATHLLVHSGEKPFVCEECGKHFRQKYHLTQHKFIHSGVKPFQCDVCNKKFNVKMNLKEHMRRHTGDRPYRCEFCDTAGFFRKKKLRDHMVKSHPNVELPADLLVLGNDKDPSETNGDMAIEFIHGSDDENKLDDDEESNLEGSAPEVELVHDKAGVVRPSVRIVRAT